MTKSSNIHTETGAAVFLPLNKLKKSPKNVRKVPHTKAEIEALAASIGARGLLQNLVVEPEIRKDEATGFYLVEDFPALFAAADQPGPFEHDQVLGDGLAGERHPSGQPAGAYRAVADQQVEDVAARRVSDGRPQLVIGLRSHPEWRFASSVTSRSRYSTQPSLCSSA